MMLMRHLLLSTLLVLGGQHIIPGGLCSLLSQPQTEGIQWFTDFATAQSASQADDKPMLVLFTGSDWCHWCVKLDKEILEDPNYAKNGGDAYRHVYIDSPRYSRLSPEQEKANAKLREVYDIQGYPTVLILDAQGNELAEAGYVPGGSAAFFKQVNDALKGTSENSAQKE